MLVNYLSGKKSIIYYISILFVVERRNQQCSLELLSLCTYYNTLYIYPFKNEE